VLSFHTERYALESKVVLKVAITHKASLAHIYAHVKQFSIPCWTWELQITICLCHFMLAATKMITCTMPRKHWEE